MGGIPVYLLIITHIREYLLCMKGVYHGSKSSSKDEYEIRTG